MVLQYGIKLAVHFITNHFGTTVAKVCENLLRKGPLRLEQLVRSTELSGKDVKNSLLVLIQHNCVQAFVYEGADEDRWKVGTHYMALFDNIIHRLRFPKFVEIVSRELDNKCVYLLEGLLRDGRLTLQQMIDRASQGKENAEATDVQETLCKLLSARYVERCPARVVSIEVTEETTTKKRGAKSAKVFVASKTTEQHVTEAAVPKEVIRFSLTADTGCNADRGTNSDDSKMINVEDDVVVKEERTLWRANFEEFIRYLRRQALVENVRARMDDGAATVLRAVLEAKKTAEEVKTERSAPLSLDTIYTEVIQTENGRAMTRDRVKGVIDRLGCPTGILDDLYTIDLKGIIQWARQEEVESIVLKRYGMDAYRMFRHVSKEATFCPTDKIAESTLVEKKDAPKLLYKLLKDNYLQMERISVMGARQSHICVWKVNDPKSWGFVLDEMFHAALNLSLRMAFEQEKGEEVINVPQDKLKGPLLEKYKRLKNSLILLGSSLMKLDDAIMLFHDF